MSCCGQLKTEEMVREAFPKPSHVGKLWKASQHSTAPGETLCLVLIQFWSSLPIQPPKMISTQQCKERCFVFLSTFLRLQPPNSQVCHLDQPCRSPLPMVLLLKETCQSPHHDSFHDPGHIFDHDF